MIEKESSIACIDMKAFYASVECVERGLDPLTTPLVVTDTTRSESTIVLSVSHYLKSKGVPSRCRKKDIPSNIEGIIYAIPQMDKYIQISAFINSIMLDYVGIDDLHIYSIDECFLDLTPYLRLNKCDDITLVKRILKDIYLQTGLIATCGIGPNMFLAKVACDKEAKKNKDYIAKWTRDDIKTKLWPIKPLNELWGISRGYLERLNAHGIYSVKDLATFPKEILIEELGVLGEELHNHANGIDETKIRDKYVPTSKGFSLGQVLMKDYSYKSGKLILSEMVQDLSFRLRSSGFKTSKVSLGVRYSASSSSLGFIKEISLISPSDSNKVLEEALLHLYNAYIDKDQLIRAIYIAYSALLKPSFDQLELFKSYEDKVAEDALNNSFDEIWKRYGKDKLLKLDALTKDSTIKLRHSQIGGHKK